MPSTLVTILNEIDYSFEDSAGIRFENYKEDKYDNKFNTIIQVFSVMDHYIENNKPKEGMINSLDVNKINVSELISDVQPNPQIILLANYLVVLTTLGPNKDAYLEKVGELPEDLINLFLEIIDVYLSSSEGDGNEVVGDVSITSKAAEIKNEVYRRQSLAQSRINSIFLNASILDERGGASILINNNTGGAGIQYMELKQQNKYLIEEIKDKDIKIKELSDKLSIQKSYEEEAYRREEYLTKELEGMMELKVIIQEKEKEIEEQKKININGSKKYIEEISQLSEKIKGFKGKEDEHRSTVKESEKLRTKLKDFETYKSKAEEYDNLKAVIESLNNELDAHRKDKALMLHKIDVLKHDYNLFTEKIKNLENEKLSMQNDLLAARKDFSEEKKRQTMISIGLRKSIKRKSTFNKTAEIDDSRIGNLERLMNDNETILEEESQDAQDVQDNIINDLERENTILKAELEELKHKIEHLEKTTRTTKIGKSILRPKNDDTEEIERVNKEKQELFKTNQDLSALVMKLENEKKKVASDLFEKSTLISKATEEKMILEQSLKKVTEKMENMCSKNGILEKEIASLKAMIDDSNKLIEKLISEKNLIKSNANCSNESLLEQMHIKEKVLMKTIKDLEDEVSQKSGLISKIENLNEILMETRSEIKDLQLNQNIKNTKIKELEEKLAKREEKLIMTSVKMKELESNYKEESDRMVLNHQKKIKSLEDQCKLTTNENKLVLDRIYEMALKYNNIKSEYDELKIRVLED